jgi:hypothetical protein
MDVQNEFTGEVRPTDWTQDADRWRVTWRVA